MADVFPVAKRSQVMAAIRATGNRDTELVLRSLLRSAKLHGWRRHQRISLNPPRKKKFAVKPDFVFRAKRVAVFVDGCFWHICPTHFNMPSSNEWRWERKFLANFERDRAVNRCLMAAGWTVVRIWEHELTDPTRVRRRLSQALSHGARSVVEPNSPKRGGASLRKDSVASNHEP